jgi:hypothetical protein
LFAIFVGVVTFGLIRIDAPRVPRVRQLRGLHRLVLAVKARYHGRRDGRLGIPRSDEVKAPPEVWRLKQQGDAVVRDLAAAWAATDARLEGETRAIDRSIAATAEASDEVVRAATPLELKLAEKQARMEALEEKDAKRQAEDRWRVPTWFYIPAILVIFAGEFPLNAVAFNLFGEAQLQTYTMTAGMAAVLVFCAHSLGILWRRRAMSDRDMVVTALLFLLPVAVVVAIAIVRESYLEALNETGDGLAILSPTMGIVIFVTMNLVIYLGAFALSYLHHDPEGEMIERAKRDAGRAERAVRAKQRQLDRIAATQRWLATKRTLWEAAREQARRSAAYQAQRHKDFFETFMEAYWASNRLAVERGLRTQDSRARRRGEPVEARTWTPPKVMQEDPPTVKLPCEFDDVVLEQVARTNGHSRVRPTRIRKAPAS